VHLFIPWIGFSAAVRSVEVYFKDMDRNSFVVVSEGVPRN